MWNWWNPYMGGGSMPYGLAPMGQRPGVGTGTMTSAADVGQVSDAPQNPFAWLYGPQPPQQPPGSPQDEQAAKRRRQQQQLQMAQYGLGMLMPRQPTHAGPY